MRRLNIECAIWIEKIEAEVNRVEELERATSTLYTDEYGSKKTMGGIHAAKDHNQATQIHTHILENRVFKVSFLGSRIMRIIYLPISLLCSFK